MTPLLHSSVGPELLHAYLWYDFFGVPQTPGLGKRNAINSIPAYINKSKYLFVLVPSLHHNDLPVVVNKGSWQQRGWCRVEQSIYTLTRKSVADTSAVFIHHAGFIQEAVPMQWLYALPHEGDFTSEMDRPAIERMIVSVARERLRRLSLEPSPFDFRFMKAVMRYIDSNHRPETDFDEWLRGYRFGLAVDAGAPDGWQPIHFAATEGNKDILDVLVKVQGVDVNANTFGAGFTVMAPKGLTPLMVAAAYIPDKAKNLETVKHILLLKGDISARNSVGQQVIHCAATGPGGTDSLEFLLSVRADLHSQDSAGETPLHCATLVNATSNIARYESIEILLKAGADPVAVGGHLGFTPWHMIASGAPHVVKLFIDYKCDPNLQLDVDPQRDALKGKIGEYETVNMAATLAVHGTKLSPLMYAVWLGNWEAAEVMLQNGADPYLKSATGRNTFDWLHDYGVSSGPTYDVLMKYVKKKGKQ